MPRKTTLSLLLLSIILASSASRADGANWDLGYTRTVQRPDGKIVTIYYFNTTQHEQQHIAATIWDPDKVNAKLDVGYFN
jgi:hypothetical protein